MKMSEITELFNGFAPEYLAESWDNPGLLVGDENAEIKKILVALDATEEVVDEAVKTGADLIVTHHPMIFGSIKKINTSDSMGRRIIKLIRNNICVFAMHTNLDIAFGGVNDELTKILGLKNTAVLFESCTQNDKPNGLGRYGDIEETTLEKFAKKVKEKLSLDGIRIVGENNRKIKRVGLCTGSGMEFMTDAVNLNCDVYITSDIKYHESQSAIENGIALIDATHYGSENIIVPVIKKFLNEKAPLIEVFESSVNGQVFKTL